MNPEPLFAEKARRNERRRCPFPVVLLTILAALNVATVGAQGPDSPVPCRSEIRFRDGIEIFSPRETVSLEIAPPGVILRGKSAGGVPDGSLTLNLSVFRIPVSADRRVLTASKRAEGPPGKEAVWEQDVTIPADLAYSGVPVSFPAPVREGIYEIVVSLHRRIERPGNAFLTIPSASLQRRPSKPLAETTCSLIVLDPHPVARPVGDLLRHADLELLETVDTHGPVGRKRFAPISSFPKVGQLVAPKIPELPRIGAFRERPQTSRPESDPDAVKQPSGSPEHDRSILWDDFLERWTGHEDESFGSGHFVQNTALPEPRSEAISVKPSEAARHHDPGSTPSPPVKRTFSSLSAAGSTQIASWQAIPLPVREPGQTHLLEIDYPVQVPQSLGIGVIEFTEENGRIEPTPILKSGFYVADETIRVPERNRTAKHRVLFRPQTRQPILLLSNRCTNRDAFFGDIRLYRVRGKEHAQHGDGRFVVPKPFEPTPRRLVAADVRRMDFPENSAPTAATERVSGTATSTNRRALYESACRLVDSLHDGGYDGAMVDVLSSRSVRDSSNGSPFSVDAAAGLATETDGIRNEAECLARLFDRERLTLIPAIDFDFSLPAVEEILSRNPLSITELCCLTSAELEESFRGNIVQRESSPKGERRYHFLHPAVQDSMLRIVRDLVVHFGRHPSFGGVAVRLTPEGYAQLADPLRGLDDRTVAQFERETGRMLPDAASAFGRNASPSRFAERERFFRAHPEEWLRWRTKKVAEFYARMTDVVTATCPEKRLYLAGGNMLDHPDVLRFCTPTLPQRASLFHALRMLGFDLSSLADIPSLTFLRPSRIAAPDESSTAASYVDFDSAGIGTIFVRDGAVPGVLFHHEAGPDGLATPADFQNRRRFARQLSQSDVLSFFDGGSAIPRGESESLYDFLAAFRLLPDVPFQTFDPKNDAKPDRPEKTDGKSIQPVAVRFANTPEGLYAYFLNDAPFDVRVEAVLSSPSGASPVELTGRRTPDTALRGGSTVVCEFDLKPYDLLAVVLDDPAAAIQRVDVRGPEAFYGKNGLLEQKIERLRRCIQAARSGVPWDGLANPGFESRAATPEHRDGWNRPDGAGLDVLFDSAVKHSGETSLKLTRSADSGSETGPVFSNRFPSPPSDRLFVALHVGVREDVSSIPLRVVLAAGTGSEKKPFYRALPVETTLLQHRPQATPVDDIRWQRIVVPFDRLPVDEFGEYRIGLDLTDSGTVWIDDVTLYRLVFTKEETSELFRLVSVADLRYSAGRISDLLTVLDGYWAQYLFQNIPETVVAARPAPPAVPAEKTKAYAEQATSPASEPPGFWNRVKGWFVRPEP